MLATCAIAALLGGALITGGDWLVGQTELPEVHPAWRHLYIGLVAIGAALIGIRRAQGKAPKATPTPPLTTTALSDTEPAPPRSTPVDWVGASEQLNERQDHLRARFLSELQRLESILTQGEESADVRILQAQRTLQQQAQRLLNDSAAMVKEEDQDVLSQVAAVVEWGVQKVPELPQMELSDLLMGKVISDIKSTRDAVEHTFIDHRKLRAIHPISRDTAIEKCRSRAEAAKAALPVIRDNGMRLSEELISANESLEPFASITGFQVVDLGGDEGFVTFEGNGRREALMMAFGTEIGILVEVRLFRFDNPETHATIARRVRRVRRWKNVVD